MLRFVIPLVLIAGMAKAQTFAFEVGSPVAAGDFRFKSAAFVFRTVGCADPSKAEISATAEGLDGVVRSSKPLSVAKSMKPGVYAVAQQWPLGGHWVISLKGACGDAIAGAVIPVRRNDFDREASKFFSHAPTQTDVNTALKAQGGDK